MKPIDPQWYRKIWDLGIKDQSWVEDTSNQVSFIVRALELTGRERVLDLACGFGRHALELARRGFSVTGVDITKDYVEDAKKEAARTGLQAEFLLSDIRDLTFSNEFDVVLNLADGAVGYLENDDENLKIFDAIARALKPGGKHFMDICNAEHAERYFPKRHWEIGTKTVSLPEFDWDSSSRRMIFSQWDITFGEIARNPGDVDATSTRLYSKDELREILGRRGMEIRGSWSTYGGKPDTPSELQLMVYSVKT